MRYFFLYSKLVRVSQFISYRYAFTWHSKFHCRRTVQDIARRKRLDALPVVLPEIANGMEDGCRFVFGQMECPVADIRVVDDPTGCVCSERFLAQLEQIQRLRLSPFRPHSQVSGESEEGESGTGTCMPTMVQPTLVPSPVESGLRHAPNISLPAGSSRLELGCPSSADNQQFVDTIRLEVVRGRLIGEGLSEDVVHLLLESNRESTSAAYQSAWRSWCNWNHRRSSNPLSGSVNLILQYLANLHGEGKSYSTINLHRSMLSSTFDSVEGLPIGQHRLVKRLMKGCFHSRPPNPRYSSMWDPTTVLDFMSRSGANSDLNLATLSQKLVTSIALATLFRVSEIASITKDSVVFSNDGVSFSLSRLRKTQRSGGFQSFSLRRINDPLICPVECLGHYVFRSDFLRNANNQSKLFIGLRKPHKEVSGSTIGRWVKNYLSLAGVNSHNFSAHSTRGAAASKAASLGVPIDSILATASWSSQSTFARFYHRPLDAPTVAGAVFESLERPVL